MDLKQVIRWTVAITNLRLIGCWFMADKMQSILDEYLKTNGGLK